MIINDCEKIKMEKSRWSQTDTDKAKRIWKEYEQNNDLSSHIGETAGIDPNNGQIWFGESIRSIVSKREQEGFTSPIFFQRVGSETYYHKGIRQ